MATEYDCMDRHYAKGTPHYLDCQVDKSAPIVEPAPVTIVAEGGARDAVISALRQFGLVPGGFAAADGVTVSVVISR